MYIYKYSYTNKLQYLPLLGRNTSKCLFFVFAGRCIFQTTVQLDCVNVLTGAQKRNIVLHSDYIYFTIEVKKSVSEKRF